MKPSRQVLVLYNTTSALLTEVIEGVVERENEGENESGDLIFSLILDPRLKMDYLKDNNWAEYLIEEEITPSYVLFYTYNLTKLWY